MGPLFALFLRSLRDDVRSRGTYIVRSVLVGLILLILWITHMDHQWSGAVGREFFSAVMVVNLVVLTLIGLSYFASAITEEKEDDTLGLLRMTNLSSLSILLGKSTGRLVGGLLFILAQLPFMLLALPMGGLRVVQILAGVSCLLGYTVFLANFGLLASIIFRKTSTASLVAGTILLPLVVGPRGLIEVVFTLLHEGLGVRRIQFDDPLDGWTRATPVERTRELLLTNFDGVVFGWQFWVSIAAAVICLLVAWLCFERFSDARMEIGRASREGKRRAFFRKQRVQGPALRWKDYHYVAGGHVAAAVKLLLCILFCVLAVFMARAMRIKADEKFGFFGLALFLSTGCTALLALSLEASRIFRVERTERTLSSLMVLPFSTRQIIWEKIRGCLATSYVLFVFMVISAVCIACFALKELGKGGPDGEEVFYFVCFTTYAVSVALSFPVFIAWLSLKLRWGAFLVGGTIWTVGNWIFAVLCTLMFREASAVIMPSVSIVILGVLSTSIPRRLEQLAAEE